MWSFTPFFALVLLIAAPDCAAVLCIGAPDLGAVIAATIAADNLCGKRAVAASGPAKLLTTLYF